MGLPLNFDIDVSSGSYNANLLQEEEMDLKDGSKQIWQLLDSDCMQGSNVDYPLSWSDIVTSMIFSQRWAIRSTISI